MKTMIAVLAALTAAYCCQVQAQTRSDLELLLAGLHLAAMGRCQRSENGDHRLHVFSSESR